MQNFIAVLSLPDKNILDLFFTWVHNGFRSTHLKLFGYSIPVGGIVAGFFMGFVFGFIISLFCEILRRQARYNGSRTPINILTAIAIIVGFAIAYFIYLMNFFY